MNVFFFLTPPVTNADASSPNYGKQLLEEIMSGPPARVPHKKQRPSPAITPPTTPKPTSSKG